MRDKLETKLALISEPAHVMSRKHYPYYHTGELHIVKQVIDMAVKELDTLIADLNAETN